MRRRGRKTAGALALVLSSCGLATIATDQPDRRTSRQSPEHAPTASDHLEQPDDPPAPPGEWQPAPRSAQAVVVRGQYVSVQVNVDANGDNIVGDAANEPSIAVDPVNPNRMAIGWRQFDTITSNFRQAGWGFSSNAGATWTFPGVLQPGIFRSDPVLASDADGVFYYYSLKEDFTCQMFHSFNGGLSWSSPSGAFGGDKAWITIDTTGGVGRGNVYAMWTGVNNFTRSTDGGFSYSAPIPLPASPFWGTMAVGPDGELYITGAASPNAPVVKSVNAQFPTQMPVFNLVAQPDMGGFTSFGGGPNPGGLLGQMWIATDHSTGPTRGNVYLLGSVSDFTGDPLDVMFTRSTDGGFTWEPPVRINDDSTTNGAYQWFGTMSVAPNGRIDVIWNDTRADPTRNFSEVYYSTSHDAGLTWSPNVPVSPPFNHFLGYPAQGKLGDYYHMVSDNGGANLAYAATFTGGQDVYFLRIPANDCNGNGIVDADDIAAGTSADCNTNGLPDECESGCNLNGFPDACDVAAGTSQDCNTDGIPDECQGGCNDNGYPDACDVAAGTSPDCDANGVPDECDPDCNGNGVPDLCDIIGGTSDDCNANAQPDECDLEGASALHNCCDFQHGPGCSDAAIQSCVCQFDSFCCQVNWDSFCAQLVELLDCGSCHVVSNDCNSNGIPDECDAAGMTSFDCNIDDVPDECQLDGNDCDFNSVPDDCQIAALIVEQPQSVHVCPASTVSFSVVAQGAVASFQWFKDGQSLIDGAGISGANSDTLVIEDVDTFDAGSYRCVVIDGCLAALSSAADLVLKEPATITAQPAAFLRQCIGRDAAFSVSATGIQPISYAWHKDGVLVSTNRILTLPSITPDDAGQYVCTVSNECRSVQSNPATLEVAGPSIVVQPQSTCVATGETAQFMVVAEATNDIFWQWFKDGDPNALMDGGNISGSSTDTLTLSPVNPIDAGSYSAVAFTIEPQPLVFCTNETDAAELAVDNCPAPGDFDGDGDLDDADFAIFLTAFGRSLGEPGYLAAADLDADGVVTIVDFQMWLLLYRDFVGDPQAAIPTGDPGDFDADGDVDLSDFARLQQCMPASPDFAFACRLKFDFDGDRAVDLFDYAEFESVLDGP